MGGGVEVVFALLEKTPSRVFDTSIPPPHNNAPRGAAAAAAGGGGGIGEGTVFVDHLPPYCGDGRSLGCGY